VVFAALPPDVRNVSDFPDIRRQRCEEITPPQYSLRSAVFSFQFSASSEFAHTTHVPQTIKQITVTVGWELKTEN
jgi:hypothetical protein